MRLEFEGKQHIYGHHLTVPISPLVPDYDESVPDTDGQYDDDNLIIHGDNLVGLKALMPRYAGQVKCIYIDPPYNTGNENWVYNDNVNSPLIQKWFEDNKPVDGEDLERHDKWLCMMWPRLQLLRELLSQEGVIFISIDDNEYHNCRIIMDEIYGESNYIGTFVWEGTGKNDAAFISVGHDYILCYARELYYLKQNKTRWRVLKEGLNEIDEVYKVLQNKYKGDYHSASEDLKEWFAGLDKRDPAYANRHYNYIDKHGVYFPGDISWPGGGGPTYEILHPKTGKPVKIPARGWVFPNKERMLEAIRCDEVHFGPDESSVPKLKRYLHKTDRQVLTSVFYKDRRAAHQELRYSLPETSFEYPKDRCIIQRLLEVVTSDEDIILDSFAGSGTTAHAVLSLNAEDGGNRKFIMVECEDYTDTITAERVRRAMRGVPDAQDDMLREGYSGSFTFCTLGQPLSVSGMLRGESLPSYRDMAAYTYYTATGRTINPGQIDDSEGEPFYRDMEKDFWLLYKPDLDWLRSSASALNQELAKRISGIGNSAVVFASHKHLTQRSLSDMGIVFCQLPYEGVV